MSRLLLRGDPVGEIKAVLLDKDGTLSNSEDHLVRVANLRIQEALKVFQANKASQKKKNELKHLLSKTYGLTTQGLSPAGTMAIASRESNLISTATVLCLLGETWPSAIDLANQIFDLADVLDNHQASLKIDRVLLPGVLNALEHFQNEGLITGLISNDSPKGIHSFLNKNNIESYIAASWSAQNTPPKPNPAAVKGLCKILKIDPKECALIGDADSDLRMAREAGVAIVLGYTSGWATPPELTQHQHLIHHWDEIRIQ